MALPLEPLNILLKYCHGTVNFVYAVMHYVIIPILTKFHAICKRLAVWKGQIFKIPLMCSSC